MNQKRLRTLIAGAGRRPGDSFSRTLINAGCDPVAWAASGPEAIELIHVHQPELVAADLVLPGTDGIQLACRIPDLPLNRYPAIILIDPAGCMPVGYDWLKAWGVRVMTGGISEDILITAISSLQAENRALPPEKQKRLCGLLDDLGVPHHPGRQYLQSAAALAWMDAGYLDNLKKQLYPAVARMHSTDAARTERAMRYAIDSAWRTGAIVHQHRIFGDTIDARRGKPTCGEMIARLADILRWEGRE